jgi:hypothetical protein
MTTWENNGIQFPRLLAEINGVMTHEQVGQLAENMDLQPHEVCELFDRADAVWQQIKDVTDASGFHPGPDTPTTVTMPAWVAIIAHEVLLEENNAISETDDDPDAFSLRSLALDEATDILAAVIPDDPTEQRRIVEAHENPTGWEDDNNMPPGTEGDAGD